MCTWARWCNWCSAGPVRPVGRFRRLDLHRHNNQNRKPQVIQQDDDDVGAARGRADAPASWAWTRQRAAHVTCKSSARVGDFQPGSFGRTTCVAPLENFESQGRPTTRSAKVTRLCAMPERFCQKMDTFRAGSSQAIAFESIAALYSDCLGCAKKRRTIGSNSLIGRISFFRSKAGLSYSATNSSVRA